MKKIVTLLALMFCMSRIAFGQNLTEPQTSSILSLLKSFGADQELIDEVNGVIRKQPPVTSREPIEGLGISFPTTRGQLLAYALMTATEARGLIYGNSVGSQELFKVFGDGLDELYQNVNGLARPFRVVDPYRRDKIHFQIVIKDSFGHDLLIGGKSFVLEPEGAGWKAPEGAWNVGKLELLSAIPVEVPISTHVVQVVRADGAAVETLRIGHFGEDRAFVFVPSNLSERLNGLYISIFDKSGRTALYRIKDGMVARPQSAYHNFGESNGSFEVNGVMDLRGELPDKIDLLSDEIEVVRLNVERFSITTFFFQGKKRISSVQLYSAGEDGMMEFRQGDLAEPNPTVNLSTVRLDPGVDYYLVINHQQSNGKG